MKKLLALVMALTMIMTMAAALATTDDGKLTIWTWDPTFNIAAMNIAKEMYQKDHPDVEIEIQEVLSEDIETNVTIAASSGDLSTLPDILLVQDNSFQKFATNYPEVYMDITDAYDFDGFGEAKVAYSVLDGRHYGIPFDAGTVVGAYRTDYLEKAGYTIADLKDITWDKLIEIGKVVKEKTGLPMFSGQAGSVDSITIMMQSCGESLFNEDGSVNLKIMDKLTQVLSEIESGGDEVILVSSGAISVGVSKMRLAARPKEIRMKQACAAVGQCELMHLYDKFFSEYGHLTAQILLTGEDVLTEEKKQNLKNTFSALLENRIIPIVNENDSVSYAQIETAKKVFGDNDTLSALVAVLVGADRLIILSDIEGLYSGDPRGGAPVTLIHRVEKIDDRIRSLVGGAGTERGRGGMATKLEAAEIVTEKGIPMHILLGSDPTLIYDALEGRDVGTFFSAR